MRDATVRMIPAKPTRQLEKEIKETDERETEIVFPGIILPGHLKQSLIRLGQIKQRSPDNTSTKNLYRYLLTQLIKKTKRLEER